MFLVVDLVIDIVSRVLHLQSSDRCYMCSVGLGCLLHVCRFLSEMIKDSHAVLANVGQYLNCPLTYFRLRATCRCLYASMEGLCPIRLDKFFALIPPVPSVWPGVAEDEDEDTDEDHGTDEDHDTDEDDDTDYADDTDEDDESQYIPHSWNQEKVVDVHVRIAAVDSGESVQAFFREAVHCDKMVTHMNSMIGLVDSESLSRIDIFQLGRLFGRAVNGEFQFPEHTLKIVRVCSLALPDKWNRVSRFDTPSHLGLILDELCPNPEEYLALVSTALRCGAAEALDILLAKSGLQIKEVAAARLDVLRGGNAALAKRVYSDLSINLLGDELEQAIQWRDAKRVRVLLEMGASIEPESPASNGRPSLHNVPLGMLIDHEKCTDDVEIAALLVKHGADVNVLGCESEDDTLLKRAIWCGRVGMCRFLLQAGHKKESAAVLLSLERRPYFKVASLTPWGSLHWTLRGSLLSSLTI